MRTRPGPGSDDFNRNDHLWFEGEWWTKNRDFWWDGTRWRHRSEPHVGYVPPSLQAPRRKPRPPGWWPNFWLGFFGVIAANIILVIIITNVLGAVTDPGVTQLLLAAPWILNLAALVVFGFVRPAVALGMLLAYGIAFGLVLLAGIFLVAVCFSGRGGVP